MTWKKYEFTDAKWAEMKAKIQKTFPDIEGGELTEYDPEKVTAVVEIGSFARSGALTRKVCRFAQSKPRSFRLTSFGPTSP